MRDDNLKCSLSRSQRARLLGLSATWATVEIVEVREASAEEARPDRTAEPEPTEVKRPRAAHEA